MMERLLDEGWLTILLAVTILVGNIFAAGLGGWKRGVKVIGIGLLVPWLIWLGLVAWCWLSEGLESCKFVIGAGLFMVGVAGSGFWLACALPGLAIGLFGHWWLRTITSRT